MQRGRAVTVAAIVLGSCALATAVTARVGSDRAFMAMGFALVTLGPAMARAHAEARCALAVALVAYGVFLGMRMDADPARWVVGFAVGVSGALAAWREARPRRPQSS